MLQDNYNNIFTGKERTVNTEPLNSVDVIYQNLFSVSLLGIMNNTVLIFGRSTT